MAKKLFIFGILVVVLVPALWLGFPYYTARTIEITVTDKERVPDGEGSYYLVFTDDEVFKNVDVWRRLKTTSSDIQGRLQEGKTFEVTVYGWRIPILSKYRNIASIRSEVSPAMVTADSLPDLKPRVEKVRETRLPTAVLFPERAHPESLEETLKARFPEVTVRVFGEEESDLWGIMIYWDPANETVIEATPLEMDGDGRLLEFGPQR